MMLIPDVVADMDKTKRYTIEMGLPVRSQSRFWMNEAGERLRLLDYDTVIRLEDTLRMRGWKIEKERKTDIMEVHRITHG